MVRGAGDVALGNALVRPAPAPAGLGRIGMRAGAEAERIDAAPIPQVVSRRATGAREIRDLVVDVPGIGERRAHVLVHPELVLVVERYEGAAGAQRVKRGS